MAGYSIPMSVPLATYSPLYRARRDLVITAGDDCTLELTVYPGEGVTSPSNVTDAGVTLSIISEQSDEVLTEIGGSVISAMSGRMNIVIPSADTTELIGRYRHTIHLDMGSGVFVVAQGVLNVAAGSASIVSDYVPPEDAGDASEVDFEDHGEVSGALEIDPTTVPSHIWVMTGDVTLTFATFSRPGKRVQVVLRATQDETGNRTITWPDTIEWTGGFSPSGSSTPGASDEYVLWTYNSGTSWSGVISAQVAPPE
ncbi:MAG TPA: hypothetical protein VF491_20440 [Vicinamibacterales bacterium]